MSTLIASLCLLTLGTPASEPSTLLLTPRSASSDVHLAARLVSGWGRISAREGKAFRIELLPNASIEHATRKLSRQSSFLFSGGGKSDPAVPGVVKRMEWEALRRENASGELDWSSLEREAEHMKAMPVADLGSRRGPTGTWQYIGPRNLYPWGQQFFGSQGNSGRVNGVAYDPNNPNTIYAAAASGGLRKSTDAGVTWQFMSGGWDMLQTSCVAVDPRPNNTVYVGTGDYHGTFSLQRQRVGRGYGMGLMKSTDGGQTWSDQVRQSSRSAFGDVAISEIIILPEAPDTVIVSTGRGQATNGKVFITTNGGLTWSSAKLSTGSEIP
ncbi:MAG TPA: sialidase family protein, partial [Fimbriimonadaceae bacterium]|nr:sialidase family protein [Fimbriimonadaceae bacterium]